MNAMPTLEVCNSGAFVIIYKVLLLMFLLLLQAFTVWYIRQKRARSLIHDAIAVLWSLATISGIQVWKIVELLGLKLYKTRERNVKEGTPKYKVMYTKLFPNESKRILYTTEQFEIRNKLNDTMDMARRDIFLNLKETDEDATDDVTKKI